MIICDSDGIGCGVVEESSNSFDIEGDGRDKDVNLKGITFTVSEAYAVITSAADLTRRRVGVTFATNASFDDGFAGLTLPLKSYKYSCI